MMIILLRLSQPSSSASTSMSPAIDSKVRRLIRGQRSCPTPVSKLPWCLSCLARQDASLPLSGVFVCVLHNKQRGNKQHRTQAKCLAKSKVSAAFRLQAAGWFKPDGALCRIIEPSDKLLEQRRQNRCAVQRSVWCQIIVIAELSSR